MTEEYLPPETEESVEISEAGPTALAILNQSEHAAMVQTANLAGNRRKLDEFDKKLMTYATHSQPVALSMFYTLPRAGKQIIGASIRFAEIVVPCWKNCAAAVRVIGDARETVTAQGVYIDYEANIRVSIEVPRRITDKNGNRFNADMIVTTANAASSIAYRNAVLRGVPRALWNPAYEAARETAVGKAMSHSQRVEAAMEYLQKLGVTEWQILNSVGVSSTKDLEVEHLVTLKVLCEEIKRGEKTIEMVFGSEFDKEIDSLFAQLGQNATQQRMLKESYMGRAEALVEYLRGRLGTTGQTTTQQTQQETKTENVVEQAATQGKRGRGRPSKEEVAAKKAAEEASAAQQTADKEPEPQKETTQEPEPQAEQKPAASTQAPTAESFKF